MEEEREKGEELERRERDMDEIEVGELRGWCMMKFSRC